MTVYDSLARLRLAVPKPRQQRQNEICPILVCIGSVDPMYASASASLPTVKIQIGPPNSTASHVIEFCNEISPGSQPIRLPIQPGSGCLPGECFLNARQKVLQEGGRIRFGWALWEWPRVYIEAEHHAVYEAPDGTLTDITPPPPDDLDHARLFLPDDTVTYDFHSLGRTARDNIRKALSPDAQIDEYLTLAAEHARFMMRTPGTGTVVLTGPDAVRFAQIAEKRERLQRDIAMRYTPKGAPCFCGSGLKFKRCHGHPLGPGTAL